MPLIDPEPVDTYGSADAAFDLFWKTYPRKQGAPAKRLVKALWSRKVKAYSVATIQQGLERQIQVWKDEHRKSHHMPMITTWLNAEAWDTLDEVDGAPTVATKDAYAFTEGVVREPTW